MNLKSKSMQTLKKTFPNGSVHTYELTEASRAGITSHRYATKDGKPFLHIMPSEKGYCNLFVHCAGYGYIKKSELMVPFSSLKVEQIAF